MSPKVDILIRGKVVFRNYQDQGGRRGEEGRAAREGRSARPWRKGRPLPLLWSLRWPERTRSPALRPLTEDSKLTTPETQRLFLAMVELRSKCSQSRYLSINHQRKVDALMKVKFHLHSTLTIRLPNGSQMVLALSSLHQAPASS